MNMMKRLDVVAARLNPWLLMFAIGLAAADLSVAAFRFPTPLATQGDPSVTGAAPGLLQ